MNQGVGREDAPILRVGAIGLATVAAAEAPAKARVSNHGPQSYRARRRWNGRLGLEAAICGG